MAIADKLTKLQTDISSAYTTISSKGGTIPSDKNTDNLSTAINSIPSGPTPEVVSKDVNFYDYDGTRLYSYTKSEFAQLESMPENPAHEGLTAQGWNWDLQEAKTYVNLYTELDIGQDYKTNDDTTRLYIEFKDDVYKSFTIQVTSTEDVTIDWGDNSTSTIGAGTSVQGTHTYNSIGKYKIIISSLGNVTIDWYFIPNNQDKEKIHKIELSSTWTYSNSQQFFYAFGNLETITIPRLSSPFINNNKTSCFHYCRNLKHLNVPKGTTLLSDNCCEECVSMKTITLPQTLTGLRSRCFATCTILARVTLPYLTSIGNSYSVFQYSGNINKLIIPSTVTTIWNNAFNNTRYCYLYDFTHHASVPTLKNTNAFGNEQVDYKIVVPDSLYTSWTGASNWNSSSIVDHIVKASVYYGS